MATKKLKVSQIVAGLALFAILVSIIGTGVLVLIGNNTANAPQELDLQEFLKNYSGSLETLSGGEISTVSDTGSIENPIENVQTGSINK